MGFDESKKYKFEELETKYNNFLGPYFVIKVGSFKIDSSRIAISSLTVQQTVQNKAGTCQFAVESQYDYENSKWLDDLTKHIAIGKVVRVQAGYSSAQKELFVGTVEDVSIEYSSGSGPRLSVTALDALGALMSDKEEYDFGKEESGAVVKSLAGLLQETGAVQKTIIGTLPKFAGQFVKSKKSSTYEFLKRLAEMCFCNLCIINGDFIFKNLISNSGDLIKLTLGTNLYEFRRSVAVTSSTVGSVTVTSNGSIDKKEVRATATKPSAYGGSGKTGADMSPAVKGQNQDYQMNFLRTQEECKMVAQNLLDQHALGFVRGSGSCVGIPELTPGRFIRVSGMDANTNGSYFLTDVTHEFSSAGYRTTFEFKGMRN